MTKIRALITKQRAEDTLVSKGSLCLTCGSSLRWGPGCRSCLFLCWPYSFCLQWSGPTELFSHLRLKCQSGRLWNRIQQIQGKQSSASIPLTCSVSAMDTKLKNATHAWRRGESQSSWQQGLSQAFCFFSVSAFVTRFLTAFERFRLKIFAIQCNWLNLTEWYKNLKNTSTLFLLHVDMYVCEHVHAKDMRVEVRGQLTDVISFFLPCGFPELKLSGLAISAFMCWAISLALYSKIYS